MANPELQEAYGLRTRNAKAPYQQSSGTLALLNAAEVTNLQDATIRIGEQEFDDVYTLRIAHTKPLHITSATPFGYMRTLEDGASIVRIKPKTGLEVLITGDEEQVGEEELSLDKKATSDSERHGAIIRQDPTRVQLLREDGSVKQEYHNLPGVSIVYR